MITSMASFIFFALLMTLLLPARAQERAPHGLAYEPPLAFPPQAYVFFHPNTQHADTKPPCDASVLNCSALPAAATVQSMMAHEAVARSESGQSHLGVGGMVGIPIGLGLALLLGMVMYFVVITRKRNIDRASDKANAQPAV